MTLLALVLCPQNGNKGGTDQVCANTRQAPSTDGFRWKVVGSLERAFEEEDYIFRLQHSMTGLPNINEPC